MSVSGIEVARLRANAELNCKLNRKFSHNKRSQRWLMISGYGAAARNDHQHKTGSKQNDNC